jgi:hypothetical protein
MIWDVQPTRIPVLDNYLKSFDSRDLERCLEFYAPGALIEFGVTMCLDKEAIERWHHERWSANLRLIDIGKTEIAGDVVTVDATVVSDRLKMWRLKSLPVRARFKLLQGKIVEARYGLRK